MEKKPRSKKGAKALDIANYEIVVLAAYLAGAQYRYVDTEDIAVKANEIVPGALPGESTRTKSTSNPSGSDYGTLPNPRKAAT